MATFEGPDPLAGVLSPGPEALVALTPAVCARTHLYVSCGLYWLAARPLGHHQARPGGPNSPQATR